MLIELGEMLYLVLRVSGNGSFPKPLTAEEERECVERMTEGDEEARTELIEHNLRLVAHVVKKYASAGHDSEDLLSIGTIGLIKAINSYRPEKGTRLATYTARCIENEILMYFRSSKKTMGEISLNEPIETDRDGGNLALMDVISIDDDMAETIDARDSRVRLNNGINSCLSERERMIIRLRYGVGSHRPPLTQRETAEYCGISRSYISRIEKKALEKLKRYMDGENNANPKYN